MSDNPPLVKPRGITRNGGRKPKGGSRVAYRFSAATIEALDRLKARWDCNATDAVERAIREADPP